MMNDSADAATTNECRKVVICGAGIGGLAMAHQLVKLNQEADLSNGRRFEVTVIERNRDVGGQARSSYVDDQYVEYCWHAFGGAYWNLMGMMEDVGILDSALVPADRWVYDQGDNGVFVEQNQSKSFLADASALKLLRTFLGLGVKARNLIFAGDAGRIVRLMYRLAVPHDDEDDVTWMSFAENIQDPVLKNWLVGFPAIYLGMDSQRLSFGTLARLYRIIDTPGKKDHDFFFPTGPMNEVFLNPWMDWLQSKGVKFLMETTITDIATDRCSSNFKISSVEVQANNDGSRRQRLNLGSAGLLVNSLDVGAWSRLMPSKRMTELDFRSRMLQCQVLFALPEAVEFEGESPGSRAPTITCHLDTPWALGCRLEFTSWEQSWVDKEGYLVSCGVGIWDAPGIVYGKPAINCSPEELAKECWTQMVVSSPHLFSGKGCVGREATSFCPRTMTGRTMEEIGYSDFRVWPYQWDDVAQTWVSDEPTFSNNVGTFKLRPGIVDEQYENLMHVNSYAKRDDNMAVTSDGIVDLFCMETAAANAVAGAKVLRNKSEASRAAGVDAMSSATSKAFDWDMIYFTILPLLICLVLCLFALPCLARGGSGILESCTFGYDIAPYKALFLTPGSIL